MRILRTATAVFIHIYICILKKNCKNPKIIIATNRENVDQSQGRKQKIGDQKLYVAVTRNYKSLLFQAHGFLYSCRKAGYDILGNSWLSPTNPGECHVPVRTRD